MATKWLETPYEIIPSGDNPIVNAQYVQCADERLDEVLRSIGNDFETDGGRISANETNIAANTTAISGLDSRVTILEEQGGGGGTSDYTSLTNKPQINGNVLSGNKTSAQLGLASASDIPSNYITGGSQTSTSSADGGSNVFTFTNANGTTSTFTVKNGSKGSQGIQGVQGEKGEKGDTGATGPQGPKGETGATGPEGPKGATGSTGPQGPKGDTGAAGSNGTSCTHSWNGTTLTVTSASGTSSANLKGEKGDKGDTGSTGPKGDTGPQGPAGQNATTTAVATTSANGLMSKDHVTKLNGIATGATAVSESTVSGWGFTKNTGTYSKPSTGIPKTDLSSAVQTSLGLADTALQSHQDISGKLSKTGDTITGNTSLKEFANLILRPNNTSYSAGICYDTKGNECISLWAKNSVTRLRWNAGTDMTTMSSGKMMDITPDFEISKASGSAKGYIAGKQIGLAYMIPSTNIVNPDEIVNGILNGSGGVDSTSGYYTSGFIDVSEFSGQSMFFSNATSELSIHSLCVYDANKSFITRRGYWIKSQTIEANTWKYIRISVSGSKVLKAEWYRRTQWQDYTGVDSVEVQVKKILNS